MLSTKEVGNAGWTGARAQYLSALREEFINRNYDYSAIGDEKGLSYKEKIRILNNRIEIIKE